MAEKESDAKVAQAKVAQATFNDGVDVDISVAQTLEYMRDRGREIVRGDALEFTDLGGGLHRIDVHLDALTEGAGFYYPEDTTIPILAGLTLAGMQANEGMDGLNPNVPYFADLSKDYGGRTELWTCAPAALITSREDAWTVRHVALMRADLETGEETEATRGTVCVTTDEDGNETERTLGDVGLDPDMLVAFHNEDTDAYVTVTDLLAGLSIMAASLGVAMQMKEARDKENGPIPVLSNSYVMQYMRGAVKRRRGKKSVTCTKSNGEVVQQIKSITDVLDLSPSGRKTFMLVNAGAMRMLNDGTYRRDGETVCRVVMSVKEAADLCGMTEASMRKKLLRDFKELANQRFSLRAGSDSVRQVDVSGGGFEISGDRAEFVLSPDFMRFVLYLSSSWLDLPRQLLRTQDGRYRAAFQLGVKICNHDNQNQGKPNQSWMKLTTLLRAATEIPRHDTVNRRHSKTERIMKPFEANMDHLRDIGVLTDWDYCHENGEPLTDEEQQAIQTERELGKPTPWEMAERWLVTWELANRWPDRDAARLAAREKRRTAAMEAKAAKEKADKASSKRIRGKVETMKAKEIYEAEKGKSK